MKQKCNIWSIFTSCESHVLVSCTCIIWTPVGGIIGILTCFLPQIKCDAQIIQAQIFYISYENIKIHLREIFLWISVTFSLEFRNHWILKAERNLLMTKISCDTVTALTFTMNLYSYEYCARRITSNQFVSFIHHLTISRLYSLTSMSTITHGTTEY